MAIDMRRKNRDANRSRTRGSVASADEKQQGGTQNKVSGGKKRRRTKPLVPAAQMPQAKQSKHAKENSLEIIPIGGLGEIGKNMTVFRYNGDILVVDCGMSFPDNEMLGIDVVIPELSFLEENAIHVKGIVVTHGHEDHIGGIPYLLQKLRAPIYGTKLTLGLIGAKLHEHGIKGDFRNINAGQKLKIGPFRIETVRATHSIADALSLMIETPAGNVFHTGDFKIDYTPISGEPMDFQKIAGVGSKGVDLMLCDSTNAIRKGFSESEKKMGPILDKIFEERVNSRIIIATFASNVHRIQTIINTAAKYKRKIALSGRSVLKVMDIAMDMGYVTIPQGVLVDLDEIKGIPDKKLVIITTGSQGEPMSALTRMAAGEHKQVKIRRGDTVILSSTPIPGNEKTVAGVVNTLIGLGADVIYSDIADIHVSGHAGQEEIKVMMSLIRPRYFMPVHGENRHLLQNAEIAESLGISSDHIIVAKNGRVVEMDAGRVELTNRTVPAAAVFVDGLGVGDIGSSVLRDRKLLSESGLIIVTAAIDGTSGLIASEPEVISRGFVYEKLSGDLIDELRHIAIRELAAAELEGIRDREAIKGRIRSALKSLIYTQTKRSPIVLPILLEV